MYATDQKLQHLAARAGTGDHAAFRDLYAMLAPATLAAVHEVLLNAEQAMHVVRATFAEVGQMCAFDAQCGTPQRDVATWVAAIAERRCDERRAALDWAALDGPPPGSTALWFGSLAAYDARIRLHLTAMIEGPDSIDDRLHDAATDASSTSGTAGPLPPATGDAPLPVRR